MSLSPPRSRALCALSSIGYSLLHNPLALCYTYSQQTARGGRRETSPLFEAAVRELSRERGTLARELSRENGDALSRGIVRERCTLSRGFAAPAKARRAASFLQDIFVDEPLPPGGTLAYFGDSVFEALVRRALLATGLHDPGRLNALALHFVTAPAQAEAVARLLPHLSPAETELYHRGRNAVGRAHPRSCTRAQYCEASGLEALFGALALREDLDRLRELFALAFPPQMFSALAAPQRHD